MFVLQRPSVPTIQAFIRPTGFFRLFLFGTRQNPHRCRPQGARCRSQSSLAWTRRTLLEQSCAGAQELANVRHAMGYALLAERPANRKDSPCCPDSSLWLLVAQSLRVVYVMGGKLLKCADSDLPMALCASIARVARSVFPGVSHLRSGMTYSLSLSHELHGHDLHSRSRECLSNAASVIPKRRWLPRPKHNVRRRFLHEASSPRAPCLRGEPTVRLFLSPCPPSHNPKRVSMSS
jgi:hypothetical protein